MNVVCHHVEANRGEVEVVHQPQLRQANVAQLRTQCKLDERKQHCTIVDEDTERIHEALSLEN